MKEIESTLIKYLQRMVGLSGIYKNMRGYRIKIKKIECLLAKLDLILTEFEEYEKPEEDII